MSAQPAAYLGTDPYIFISYAHADREKVFPFIAALQKRYNVWFDNALHFGAEWEAEIAKNLRNCSVFIFMVSGNSLRSLNCKDELHFARNAEKPFINIHIEQIPDIPDWFSLRYMRYQDCRLYTYGSYDDVIADLAQRCPDLAMTRVTQGAGQPEPPAAPAPEPEQDEDPLFTIEQQGKDVVLTKIGNKNVRNVVVPDGVTRIAIITSELPSLAVITIPKSVKAFRALSFSGRHSLKTVYYEGDIADWLRIEFEPMGGTPLFCGAGLYIKGQLLTRLVVPSGITTIPAYSFNGCSGLREVVIPEGVTMIEECAFGNCRDLKKVSIPESCIPGFKIFNQHMGPDPFYNTDLNYNRYDNALYLGNERNSYLVLMKAVSKEISSVSIHWRTCCIYEDAFFGCGNLKNVVIPFGVRMICAGAFSETGLTSISISDSVTAIGSGAFELCEDLTSVILPDALDHFGRCSAFDGCEQLTLRSYDNALYLGSNSNPYLVLFQASDPGIDSVTLHPNTRFIHSDAFSECEDLETVELNEGLAVIGDSAFSGCTLLDSITIPDSVTEIGESAFEGCESLETVTLGAGLKTVGESAFKGCENVSELYYNGNSWDDIDFGDDNDDLFDH